MGLCCTTGPGEPVRVTYPPGVGLRYSPASLFFAPIDQGPGSADGGFPDNAGMSTNGIILIGGGGHAKVVFDALRESDAPVIGFVDDSAQCALSGVIERLGPIDGVDREHPVIVAIGDVATRRRVLGQVDGVRVAGPVIHPSAVVSPSASLGDGVFIGPGAIVNADARIDAHAIINSGSIVEHDCRVGRNTHIAPGCVLGGGAVVGDDTLVGLGSRVLPGVKIGSGCVVGAGAVLTESVESSVTVVGVPGRVTGSVAHL